MSLFLLLFFQGFILDTLPLFDGSKCVCVCVYVCVCLCLCAISNGLFIIYLESKFYSGPITTENFRKLFCHESVLGILIRKVSFL